MQFGTVISWYLGSHFTENERNRWRKFFSSSENAIWSILLNYQEIDVTTVKTSYIVAFFNGTNRRFVFVFVDYKYWKSGHYTFILVGNSLSVAQKVHDFRYRK